MPEDPCEQAAVILGALRDVVDPCSIATGLPISLPDMGLIKSLQVLDGAAIVVLRVTSPLCMQVGNIIDAVESRLRRVAGITTVVCTVDPGVDWTPAMMAPKLRRGRQLA